MSTGDTGLSQDGVSPPAKLQETTVLAQQGVVAKSSVTAESTGAAGQFDDERGKDYQKFLTLLFAVWTFCGILEYWWRSPDATVSGGIHAAAAFSFLVDLFVVGGVVACIGRALTGQYTGIALNGLNQFSLSRAQMAAWTIVVVAALSCFARIRIVGFLGPVADPFAITIPGDLLAAMGISAFTTVATPAILAFKSNQPQSPTELAKAQDRLKESDMVAGTFTAKGKALVRRDRQDAGWSDMLLGDEVANAAVVDISKVQQMLVTVLLVVGYTFLIFNALATGYCLVSDHRACPADVLDALPALSDSFVALLALSHAGYLSYKIAPKAAASVGGQ